MNGATLAKTIATHPPITALAHEHVARVISTGDLAIDATVGNGHDTLFLAHSVGAQGRVIGFEIQPQAVAAARALVAAAGVGERAKIVQAGHQYLPQHIPPDWHGNVAAIMFNLGYCPGGDKTIVTRAPTTLAALAHATRVLRPGGLVSLAVYRAHAGGAHEAQAISRWLAGPGSIHFHSHQIESPGPWLYLLTRRCYPAPGDDRKDTGAG